LSTNVSRIGLVQVVSSAQVPSERLTKFSHGVDRENPGDRVKIQLIRDYETLAASSKAMLRRLLGHKMQQG